MINQSKTDETITKVTIINTINLTYNYNCITLIKDCNIICYNFVIYYFNSTMITNPIKINVVTDEGNSRNEIGH